MNSTSGGDPDAGLVVRYETALLAAMPGGSATAPGAGAMTAPAPVDGNVNAAVSAFTAGDAWAVLRADERFTRAFGDGPTGSGSDSNIGTGRGTGTTPVTATARVTAPDPDRDANTITNPDRASALHGSNAPSAPTPLLETALISTESVAILVRCALGDWSGPRPSLRNCWTAAHGRPLPRPNSGCGISCFCRAWIPSDWKRYAAG